MGRAEAEALRALRYAPGGWAYARAFVERHGRLPVAAVIRWGYVEPFDRHANRRGVNVAKVRLTPEGREVAGVLS